MLVEDDVELLSKLKTVFGFHQFRGEQEAIIQNLLSGRNTFVLMPTGAGKSLCYQLPAITLPGTAIVISPLIALMKNQVDQMNATGVNAQFLNSTLSKGEMTRVKKEVSNGNCKLLYVAPESLTKEENVSFLQKADISFVAIDEAHCISEWGHDFRPEYRRIRTIIDKISTEIPIIALTATATPKVQMDIRKNLEMDQAELFKSSFNRTNLFYEIRSKNGAKKQLIKFIKARKGESGIIYCLSRKKVEEIAAFLKVNDVKALPYHAGLDSDVRMRNQDAFLNEDADVIVATIAFGMGIDKPDVRFVIHFDAPKSLEGYYQETGRAGRDGIQSDCLMFYSYSDIVKLEKFNKDKSVSERENSKILLEEMAAYAESAVCRRKQIMNYFGETYGENCNNCDNCRNPKKTFEGKDLAKLVLDTVKLTEEKFQLTHIAQVIAGIETDYVLSYHHNTLPVFAKGAGHDLEYWTSVVRQVYLHGLLSKDIEEYGVLKLNEKSAAFLKNPHSIELIEDHVFEINNDEDDEGTHEQPGHQGCDTVLLQLLKDLRRAVAKEKGLPPYVIFQDPSLEEMATVYPSDKEALSHINGVGMGKVERFGDRFIEMIAKYVIENDIEVDQDVIVKTASNKSKSKVLTIQQIDRKTNLDEIASDRGVTMNSLIEEIEHICFSGTRLNIDYYIDEILNEDSQDEIMQYFRSTESDHIPLAIDYFDGDYSEEDLRLMRVKFYSTFAI
jgi:ATP-dependent DNA helicase RecQ